MIRVVAFAGIALSSAAPFFEMHKTPSGPRIYGVLNVHTRKAR